MATLRRSLVSFDEDVLHRPARRDVVPFDLSLLLPVEHRVRGQLCGVVGDHQAGIVPPFGDRIQLPGSFCIPCSLIPSFAGWFIAEGERIALIGDTERQLHQAMRYLVRIGLDNVVGGFADAISATAQGHDFVQ